MLIADVSSLPGRAPPVCRQEGCLIDGVPPQLKGHICPYRKRSKPLQDTTNRQARRRPVGSVGASNAQPPSAPSSPDGERPILRLPTPSVPSPGVPSPGVPSPGVPSPGVPLPSVPFLGVPLPDVTSLGVLLPDVPSFGVPLSGVPLRGVPVSGGPPPAFPLPIGPYSDAHAEVPTIFGLPAFLFNEDIPLEKLVDITILPSSDDGSDTDLSGLSDVNMTGFVGGPEGSYSFDTTGNTFDWFSNMHGFGSAAGMGEGVDEHQGTAGVRVPAFDEIHGDMANGTFDSPPSFGDTNPCNSERGDITSTDPTRREGTVAQNAHLAAGSSPNNHDLGADDTSMAFSPAASSDDQSENDDDVHTKDIEVLGPTSGRSTRSTKAYIENDNARTKRHSERVIRLMKNLENLSMVSDPYILVYISRPESILLRNGKAKVFMSRAMEKVLKGHDLAMQMHALARAYTRSQELSRTDIRQLNARLARERADKEAAEQREREAEEARVAAVAREAEHGRQLALERERVARLEAQLAAFQSI